ncbi:sensor histidine kinase [Caproiciproducens sp. LBM24188]|nr:histidine kinase [Clostridiales bacterium]
MKKENQKQKKPFPFAVRVFLMITLLLILPVYCMFVYINNSFTSYLDQEISTKTVQNIAKSEEEIYGKLENLINVSNLFISDTEFEKVMSGDRSYYEKCKYFDSSVNRMMSSNVFNLDELRISFFDSKKNLYTNWGVNYHDYSFMLNEDWVKESINAKGYLTWNMFENSQIQEEKNKNIRYISLTRSFSPKSNSQITTGSLIISMKDQVIMDLLEKYRYGANDNIFIYSRGFDQVFSAKPISTADPDMKRVLQKLTGKNGSITDTVHSNKYIISYYTLSKPWNYKNNELTVVAMTDYQSVAEKTQEYMMQTMLFFILFMAVMVIVVFFISRAIVKPIRDISRRLSGYQVGDTLVYGYRYNDEIGQLYGAFSKMDQNIRDLFEKLKDEYAVKERYRFDSLRAQINPHFLFNTLNSIRWMAIIKKQDNIVGSIDALTGMLEYSMNKGSEFVSLGQELKNIDSYISIQNMRYGEHYRTEIDIPEELYRCEVIKFSLQPIVENCIIHGFRDFSGQAVIEIHGNQEEDVLHLYVEDNGKPISEDAIREFQENKGTKHRDEKKVTGIGMANVDEIIRITYGEEYGLDVQVRGDRTVVCYTLPYRLHGGIEDCNEKDHDC